MTEKERHEIEEEAIRKFAWQRKIIEDAETVAAYERKLRAKKKHYMQSAEAFSLGGRRNRALALGECCLQAMDALQKEIPKHKFVLGTLSWIIGEDRAVDTDGKKGYKYTVAYHIYADEQAMTDDEIETEVEETRKRIEEETREMFQEIQDDDEAPPFDTEG